MIEITPDHERKAFGARLAAARAKAKLTQAQLGEGLGTDGRDLQKGAVSAWEVGASAPNSDQLRTLCERLGVSADHLLDIESASDAKAGV